MLPVRSVGVQGDCRTYRHPVVLWRTGGGPVGWDVAEAAATELANRVCGVNRVVLAVEDLEGRELRVRPTWLDRTAVARLQELDLRVRRRLAARAEVWQVPVVTLPLFDAGGRQAYVVRPVTSTDAMTADFYRLEPDALLELCAEIDALGGFGPMLYDVSSKPPATIEWE